MARCHPLRWAGGAVSTLHVLVFPLADLSIGLPLGAVERVLQAAALSPLPGAPSLILGLLVFHGRAIPVGDTRLRFALPPRPLRSADVLILCRGGSRSLALLADGLPELRVYDNDRVFATASLSKLIAHIPGVVPGPDGCVLIHDLDRFMSFSEHDQLEEALRHV